MYVAKCTNASYMNKKLGSKIDFWMKILMGFSLMVFVLILLAGPILLFSSINPIGVIHPVTGGALRFDILIKDTSTGS